MSKMTTIRIKNFKAIDSLELNFNGCTAIVTAGNNKGKTSALRGIIDRIRFKRPDVMVKQGAEEGSFELTLDSGEKFTWQFDIAGTDRLLHVSQDGVKTPVTKAFGSKFFPPSFDIDEFLNSSPKEQVKQLQKIVGVDFTDVDARYEAAYKERTARNEDAERFHVKLSKMLEVPKVDAVDLTELQTAKQAEKNRLNELYLLNKDYNDKLRSKHDAEKKRIDAECKKHNEDVSLRRVIYNACNDALSTLKKYGYSGDATLFVGNKSAEIGEDRTSEKEYPKEPTYIIELPSDEALQAIDKKILDASEINTKAKAYVEYIDLKYTVEAAKLSAKEADDAVKAIEDERRKMIEAAKFPEGITIDSSGIKVDGLPLDNNQVSSSRKYTAALQIGAIVLGEVKTLYFDASYCDRHTLDGIFKWAEQRGLQLLIERPDYEGGEIKYEIIEEGLNNG